MTDEAVLTLTMLRSPMLHGDAGARLHALVSLMAQADVLLADAVADAWDQGYRWREIGRHRGVLGHGAMHPLAADGVVG